MRLSKRVITSLAAVFGFIGVAWAADSTSTYLQLLLMGAGLHSNDWGDNTNTNLQKIESAMAASTTVASGGGGTVTLTDAQARYQFFSITGTLTSNSIITWPSYGRKFVAKNDTSGAYTVTAKCGAGVSVAMTAGQAYNLYCDGSNIIDTAQSVSDPIPVGTMFNWAGASAPNSNYLLCDGSAISRTTYSSLYSTIGTTYGAGDTVTTFNIPDTRGRVQVGPDNVSARIGSVARGATTGSYQETLTTTELPAHTHTITDPGHTHGVTDPGHFHNFPSWTGSSGGSTAAASGQVISSQSGVTTTKTTGVTVDSGTTGITATNSNGSGAAFSLVQPTLVTNCIIKAL
jgi:microcystin-dependent protein